MTAPCRARGCTPPGCRGPGTLLPTRGKAGSARRGQWGEGWPTNSTPCSRDAQTKVQMCLGGGGSLVPPPVLRGPGGIKDPPLSVITPGASGLSGAPLQMGMEFWGIRIFGVQARLKVESV